MRKVTLYGKPDCPLCDVAEGIVRGVCGAEGYEKVDISADPALQKRYGNDIPVIAIDDVDRFRGRIRRDELVAALQ